MAGGAAGRAPSSQLLRWPRAGRAQGKCSGAGLGRAALLRVLPAGACRAPRIPGGPGCPWLQRIPAWAHAVIARGPLPGPGALESSGEGGQETARTEPDGGTPLYFLPSKTGVLIRTTLLHGVLTWPRFHFIPCCVAAATGEVGTILVSLLQVKKPRLRAQATRQGHTHSPKEAEPELAQVGVTPFLRSFIEPALPHPAPLGEPQGEGSAGSRGGG